MLFQNKRLENYDPISINENLNWKIAHVTTGVVDYAQVGKPAYFTPDIGPSWLQDLYADNNQAELSKVSDMQEEYAKEILAWVDRKKVVDVFIGGAEEDRERQLLKPYNVPKEGHFQWNSKLVDSIPELNIYNFYIKAEDGTIVIFCESGANTIFMFDPNNKIPDKIMLPWVKRDNI